MVHGWKKRETAKHTHARLNIRARSSKIRVYYLFRFSMEENQGSQTHDDDDDDDEMSNNKPKTTQSQRWNSFLSFSKEKVCVLFLANVISCEMVRRVCVCACVLESE